MKRQVRKKKKPVQSAFTKRSFFSSALNSYLEEAYASLPETETTVIQKELRKRAKKETIPIVSEEVYAFLRHSVCMKQPKRILEVGTGGGYSTLALIDQFEGEQIISLDLSDHNVTRFQHLQEEFPALKKVEIVFCDALDYMQECTKKSFDLIFIDAQKKLYPAFLNGAIPLLNKRGVIIFDNIFFLGESFDSSSNTPHKKYLQGFTETFLKHPMLSSALYPIGDGIGFACLKQLI